MSDPALPPSPTASGKTIVLGFLALAVIIGVVAIALRYSNQDRIRDAQVKALPTLAANIHVTCDDPARGPVELKRRGRCPNGATLLVDARDAAPGTKGMLFALLSATHAKAGSLPLERTVKIPLENLAPGPYQLSVILADRELKPEALQAALDAKAAADVRERLQVVESFVSEQIQAGGQARAERLDFQLEDARANP